MSVGSDTVLRLVTRAPLPGPSGALVEPTLAAPIYEYATIRLRDLDVPWQADSIDVELASYGSLHLDETGERQRVDGDISVASVRHRYGPVYLLLGRQVRTGGAARLTRFDGVAAGGRAPLGLGADGYGGLAVLPRWSERPGYHLLGSAADTLIRSPDALPDPSRGGYWVAGGRAYYAHATLGELGASFHEQSEAAELGRRTLAFDLRATPHAMVAAVADATVDLDSIELAELRAALDVFPLEPWALAAEYQRAVPALFLSRQSVLGVFSTERFDEVGGLTTVRPWEALELGAGGYVELFGDGATGSRLLGRVRLAPLAAGRLVLHGGYGRVAETDNGYHSWRVAAGSRVLDPLELTAETHLYLYDEPVRRARPLPAPETTFSFVAATTAEWTWQPGWATLLGGALTSSPYALVDAQAFARLRIDLLWEAGGS